MIPYIFGLLAISICPGWKVDTPVYRPYGKFCVVKIEGQYILLDKDESKCHIVDPLRGVIGSFGKKGTGPGAFEHPRSLASDGYSIFVIEANFISRFEPNGALIEKVRNPYGSKNLLKMRHGWIVYDFLLDWDPYTKPSSASIFWVNEQFENRVDVKTWKIEAPKTKFLANGYNPISKSILLDRDEDLNRIYFCHPDELQIFSFDIESWKTKSLYSENRPPPKFDDSFGETFLTHMNQLMANQPEHKYRPNFPDTFPVVASLRAVPGGSLVIGLYTENGHAYDWFELNGSRLMPAPSFLASHQLVERNNSCAVVTGYANEAAYIRSINFNEVESFIKENSVKIEDLMQTP